MFGFGQEYSCCFCQSSRVVFEPDSCYIGDGGEGGGGVKSLTKCQIL